MFNKLFNDSLVFFRNHFIAFAAIILPVVVPVEFISMFVLRTGSSEELTTNQILIAILLDFLVSPVYMVAATFYIASIIQNEHRKISSLWGLGLKFWLPYLVLSVMIGLVVSIGLLMFILPGIFFAVRYAFAQFELLFNQQNPPDAIRNSWRLTADYQWLILSGFAMITVLLYGPLLIFSSVFNELMQSNWVIGSVINLIYAVLTMLYTIFAFRVYDYASGKAGSSAL
jgi:hypothetical protein